MKSITNSKFIRCPYCGTELTSNAKFCKKCGNKLETEMTYTEAVSLARQGDNRGIDYLYTRVYARKMYVAYRYVQNEYDAQDVFQDAFLRAVSNLDQLGDPEKFESWFAVIVANTAKNALQKKNKEAERILDKVPDEDEPEEYDIEDVSVEFRPEEQFDRQEIAEIVNEMLGTLSDSQRMCTIMRYFEEIPVKEIAQAMNLPEGTVKSNLNYARKKLNKQALELVKKGYQLRGISAVAIVAWALKAESNAMVAESAFTAAGAAVLSNITTAAGTAKAAGTTAAGTAKAAGTTAAGTAKAAGTTAAGTAKAAGTTAAGTAKAAGTTAAGTAQAAGTAAAQTAGAKAAGAAFLGSTAVKGGVAVVAAVAVAAGGYNIGRSSYTPPEVETVYQAEAPVVEEVPEIVEEVPEVVVEEPAEPENPYRTGTVRELEIGQNIFDAHGYGRDDYITIELDAVDDWSYLNGVRVLFDAGYDELTQEVQGYYAYDAAAYYITMDDGEYPSHFLYLNLFMDNDFATVFVWNMDDEAPVYMGSTRDSLKGFHRTDQIDTAEDFTMSGITRSAGALSTVTITRHYHVGENGLPEASEDWYTMSGLGNTETPSMTALQDINAEIVEDTIDGKVPEAGTPAVVPAGTVLTFYRTDEMGRTDMIASDGTIYRFTSEEHDGSSPSIDGVDVYQLFDGVHYAV